MSLTGNLIASSTARRCWIGVLVALAYALIVTGFFLGAARVNPAHTGWLTGDFYSAYLAWTNFRLDQAPALQLSMTRLSAPLPINIAMFDAMPLLMLPLKLLPQWVPADVQFIGLHLALCAFLQGIFGFLLFREYAIRYHSELATTFFAAVATGFVAAAPVFVWRWQGHASLSAQWLIIAGFWLYVRADRASARTSLLSFSVLFAVAAGISPYILVMLLVIYGGFLVKLPSMFGRPRFPGLLAGLIPIAVAPMALWMYGYFALRSGGFRPGGGYGYFSANILSLLDPADLRAGILPPLWRATTGQREGYGYLGFGAVLMSACALLLLVRRLTITRQMVALALTIFVGFILSLSTDVTLGPRVLVHIPLPGPLAHSAATLRASGRFIWVAHYGIVIGSALVLARQLSSRYLALAVATLAAIQFVDLAPTWTALRSVIQSERTNRLHDPAWASLSRVHRALMVVPPWECNPAASPGGLAGFERLGGVALENRMVTNSFYAGRLPRNQWDYHCLEFQTTLRDHTARSDAAYAVSQDFFDWNRPQLTATHYCELADKLILCRADGERRGIGPRLSQLLPLTVRDGLTLSSSDPEGAKVFQEGWARRPGEQSTMMLREARLRFTSGFATGQAFTIKLGVRHIAGNRYRRDIDIDVYAGSYWAGRFGHENSLAPFEIAIHVPAGLFDPDQAFSLSLVDRSPPALEGLNEPARLDVTSLTFAADKDLSRPVRAKMVFGKEAGDQRPLVFGWSIPEDGVWSDGPRAAIILPNIGNDRALDLAFDVIAFVVPEKGLNKQIVRITVGKDFADTIELHSWVSAFSVHLPAGVVRESGPHLRMMFQFPNAASPEQLSLSGDARRVAMGLKSITLSTASR